MRELGPEAIKLEAHFGVHSDAHVVVHHLCLHLHGREAAVVYTVPLNGRSPTEQPAFSSVAARSDATCSRAESSDLYRATSEVYPPGEKT